MIMLIMCNVNHYLSHNMFLPTTALSFPPLCVTLLYFFTCLFKFLLLLYLLLFSFFEFEVFFKSLNCETKKKPLLSFLKLKSTQTEAGSS